MIPARNYGSNEDLSFVRAEQEFPLPAGQLKRGAPLLISADSPVSH